MEDGEVESDLSCYRVISSKTLADVVEALIGIYYVEGGKNAAHHLMNWIGIQVELDPKEVGRVNQPYTVPESILRSVNFDSLEGALNIKFNDKGLLVEAITHVSRPSAGVSYYQRLEFTACNSFFSWNYQVFQPLLQPMVTPETLPMHPVRELQERCQQHAEGLEYKATRNGNLTTVEVYVDGIQIGIAQNPQKKMAQKLAARNALVTLKEKEKIVAKEKSEEIGSKKNGNQAYTRQTLNDICLRRQWPMPQYRCVHEGGPAHAKRFTYSVRVNTNDKGWTDDCIGQPMPSVKKAKDSAAVVLLELLNRWYGNMESN